MYSKKGVVDKLHAGWFIATTTTTATTSTFFSSYYWLLTTYYLLLTTYYPLTTLLLPAATTTTATTTTTTSTSTFQSRLTIAISLDNFILALKTLTSLNKESRPFFQDDNSIWKFALFFFP